MADTESTRATHGERLCIVPRWAATQDMEWYPWLCQSDLVRARFAHVLRPEIDDPGTPTIDAWVAALTRACGTDAESLARTWFVGHSVGCQAILRYLNTLPAGVKARGALLVAGWWTVDAPWGSIKPWLYTAEGPGEPEAGGPSMNLARVRGACQRFSVLISDNDPFTADHRATERAFVERLGAEVTILPGQKHFNGDQAPAVLPALDAFTRPA